MSSADFEEEPDPAMVCRSDHAESREEAGSEVPTASVAESSEPDGQLPVCPSSDGSLVTAASAERGVRALTASLADAAKLLDAASGYKVGPGKPPLHTRFRIGRSGNPNGRPKGRTLKQTFLSLAQEHHAVGVDPYAEIDPTANKLEAALLALFRESRHGNVRAIRQVCELYQRFGGGEVGEVPEASELPSNPFYLGAPDKKV